MQPLENVIWQSLTTRHADFAEGSQHARRFPPQVTSLGAFFEPSDEGYQCLASLLPLQGAVGIFLDQPYEPRPGWQFVAGAPLLQMINEDGAPLVASTIGFLELGDADSPEMQELAALTRPGPFGNRTHELGTYLGIRIGGKLIAMAGERLKVPGHTEISAVCTHPDYLGKGYAGTLMSELIRRIRASGETPFLHSRGDNTRAIELYKRLGFRESKHGHYAVVRRMI